MSLTSISSSQDLFAPSSETRRLHVFLAENELTNKLGMKKDEAEEFLRLRERFIAKPPADWDHVSPPPNEVFVQYDALSQPSKEITKQLLEKLVVVELNGGLGTSMGCKGSKSVLQILKQSLTFLDCKVMQIEDINDEFNVDVPLVLMNSFNTDEEAKKIISKYKGRRVTILTCLQSKYPIMYRDTAAPVAALQADKNLWYPGGSGEVFSVLRRSGLLEQFRKQGKEYVFVSNVENLGATVDFAILNHFGKSSDLEFLLEVTNRISTDSSGGMPVKYKDNNVHILDLSQVPPQISGRFSVSNYKYWNTNNIWVKIPKLIDMLEKQSLDIEFVVKYRSINGRSVLQVETPASMAIHSFRTHSALTFVPRSRFKPVKTTSQLLAMQSELYEIEKGKLVMNPKRVPATDPLVKLGEEFRRLDEYEKRFKTIPNILELDHLTVSGDVTFGSRVTLKGTVIVVADTGSRIDIPDGAVLENRIVAGSIMILDH